MGRPRGGKNTRLVPECWYVDDRNQYFRMRVVKDERYYILTPLERASFHYLEPWEGPDELRIPTQGKAAQRLAPITWTPPRP